MIRKAGNVVTTIYLLIMFCIYPFYMENGYQNIGEAKNRFFLWVSISGFVVLLMLYIAQLPGELREKRSRGCAYLIDWDQVSMMDIMVLVYGTFIFLSYAFSDYKTVAGWGAEGWYMGCLPILFLCGLYFLLSRMWNGTKVVLSGVLPASTVVFLLGICNRFSFYPISFEVTQPDFISTLGNINWFCGYLTVIAPLGIGLFVVEKDSLPKRMLLGIYAFVAFMAGFCQGSSSVFLWFGALFFFLLWISIGKRAWMKNWLLLLMIWGVSAQTVRLLRQVFPGKYNYDADNICGYFTDASWSLWIGLAAALVWFALTYIKSNKVWRNAQKIRRWLMAAVLFGFLAWLVLALIHTFLGIDFLKENTFFLLNAEWGHGRGVTFYAGVRAFWEMPFLHKIIGVGPDCFAEFAYELQELAVILRDNFGSARLTNAHSELLTALVNTGICGVCAYVGIFVTFIRRCSREAKEKPVMYIPALCLLCYLIHNTVSFAQVLNFPYVFLILGMSEAVRRKQKKCQLDVDKS